jgi:hypothetical protein
LIISVLLVVEKLEFSPSHDGKTAQEDKQQAAERRLDHINQDICEHHFGLRRGGAGDSSLINAGITTLSRERSSQHSRTSTGAATSGAQGSGRYIPASDARVSPGHHHCLQWLSSIRTFFAESLTIVRLRQTNYGLKPNSSNFKLATLMVVRRTNL